MGIGVYGYSSSYIGIQGECNSSAYTPSALGSTPSAAAMYAVNAGGGVALYASGYAQVTKAIQAGGPIISNWGSGTLQYGTLGAVILGSTTVVSGTAYQDAWRVTIQTSPRALVFQSLSGGDWTNQAIIYFKSGSATVIRTQ